ncbi:MAG: hypothetical protein ACI81R_000897 [Bradymonadia bacterium]|jgi:hypothetical protein
MQQKLEKALIERGVVSATLLDDARHAAQSGDRSLLLTLLASGADEDAICDLVAEVFRLQRVSDAHLASVRPSAFQRVPAEVLHDAAMVPLRFGASKELHVAVVDPTQKTKLDEAEFFAGVPLVVHVLTATQMSSAFERLSGRPWSVGESIATRPTGAKRVRVEPLPEGAEVEVELTLLHRKHVSHSAVSGARVSVTDSFAIGNSASPEQPITLDLLPEEPQVLERRDASKTALERPEFRVAEHRGLIPIGFPPENELLESDSRDPLSVIFDTRPAGKESDSDEERTVEPLTGQPSSKEATGDQPISGLFSAGERVSRLTGGVSRLDSNELNAVVRESRTPLVESEVTAEEPLGARGVDDFFIHPLLQPSGASDAVEAASLSPTDETGGEDTAGPWSNSLSEATAGRSLPVFGFGDGSRETPAAPEPLVRESTLSRAPRPAVDSPTPRERRTNEIPRLKMKAAQRRRMSTTSAVVIPADIANARVPNDGELESVSSLARRLGEADKPTAAAYAAAISGVEAATNRDGVVTQLVDALGCVYPNVLVLSVVRPDLVVWAAQTDVAYPRLVGSKFEVAPDSVWDKVTTELLAYSGPLPPGDPLRRVLRRSAGDNILILPVTLNKRAILLLVMNDSRSQVLRAPGRSATALVRSVGRALKRVILNTKRTG